MKLRQPEDTPKEWPYQADFFYKLFFRETLPPYQISSESINN